MAMDALKNITTNVPDWLQRLGELSGTIDQRQVELAALGQSTTKSIRNRGSNESLLKKERDVDEGSLPNSTGPEEAEPTATEATTAAEAPTKPEEQASPKEPAVTSSDIKQQTTQAVTLAQARARAAVRKKHRSQSICSVEGQPAAYRSRSMIIVYYDSYVENFFEELVKFVSASRNLMRKAKMAAKVAQIKRMAEMEHGDDEDPDKPARIPTLRHLSSRSAAMSPALAHMRSRGGPGGKEEDFYDKLDKNLEYVQSMCERAAHQFLRDGDCSEEINGISTRLADAKELADKECERILREEPELAQEPADVQKSRMHRPPAVRRELSGNKDSSYGSAIGLPPPAAADPLESRLPYDQPLEADDSEDDEGFDEVEIELPPRRILRSTSGPQTEKPEIPEPTKTTTT